MTTPTTRRSLREAAPFPAPADPHPTAEHVRTRLRPGRLIGDVLLTNAAGTGVDIVATKNVQ